MKLTLDTNVLWDAADTSRGEWHKKAQRLLNLHDQGACEIYRTTRVEVDVPLPPVSDRLNALPQLAAPPIGTAFRLDYSALGSGDVLADEIWVEQEARLRAIIFTGIPEKGRKERSRKADLDHLMGHWRSRNDVFVTRDEAILRARERLLDECGIRVMGPKDVLRLLSSDGEER